MRHSTITSVSLLGVLALSACGRVDQVNAPARPKNAVVAFAPLPSNLTESVPGAIPSPAGLRACFAGESNANDVVSGNVGTLNGTAGYTTGRIGQAFNFIALNDGVYVPPSASLDIGTGTGLTMAAWVYGRGTSFGGAPGPGPIVEFDFGAHLWHHNQQGSDDGLFTNLALSNAPGDWHIVYVEHAVPWNSWHHTAVTYDKASGEIALYVDGVRVIVGNQGNFTPNTATNFRIGFRMDGSLTGGSYTYNGAIDEVQLYDRGLIGSEIAQLASGAGTMCVPPPVSYQVTQMPAGSGESGVPFATQPVVAILDANNNVVSNATTPVTATLSGAGTLLGTTTVNAVGGLATFTDLAIAGVGSPTIGFTTAALPAEPGFPTTSAALPTVQVARQLGISTQPGGAPSNALLVPQPVIEIRDAAGLHVPGTTGTITASIASGPGVLNGTVTANAVNGIATFSNLSIQGAGLATLNFAASGLASVTSAPFMIAALPASQLAILTQPAGAESGMPFTTQPVIEIRSADGTRATAAVGTVTAAVVSGSGTIGGTVTVPIVNGLATFYNLQVNGFGAFGLRFTSGALTPVNSAVFTSTQVVRQLAITASPPVLTSGALINPPFVVEMRDAAGIRVSTVSYLLRINLVNGVGSLAGTTEVNAVNGVVTYTNVRLLNGAVHAGFSFWVVDAAAGDITPFVLSGLIPVQAAVPAELRVVTHPAGAESGVPFTTQPVVEVLNTDGARATTAAGTVTAAIVSGSGSMVGTVTVPIINGLATFSNLQINGFGAFSLRFTSGALTPANSATFVATQVVRQLVVISGPTVITSDLTMSPPFVVGLRDAAGIPVATSSYLVRMSLVLGAGTLAGTRDVNAVNGVVTFTNVQLMNGAVQARFGFVVIDPAAGSITPSTQSGLVTVLTNEPPPPPPPTGLLAGLIRKGPTFNAADIQGSLQIINADNVTFNGNAQMSGTLYLRGMPAVNLTGQSSIGTTTVGTGSATPTSHTLTMHGQARLGTLAPRTNPVTMPVVAPPTAPIGTRSVVLNSATDAIGPWATVRDLTMRGNAGTVTMPGGAYGDVTVSGQNRLVIGVAGSTTPTAYHFQSLSLNSNTTLEVVGPVVVTVGSDVTMHGTAGAAANAEWLVLKVYRHAFTLGGGASITGIVIAPDGMVTVNGNSSFIGGLAADDLTLNGNHVFRITKAVPTP